LPLWGKIWPRYGSSVSEGGWRRMRMRRSLSRGIGS